MKKDICAPEPKMRTAKKWLFPSRSHLLRKQIQIGEDKLRVIEKSIKDNYHTGWRSESNYSKEMYEKDLKAQLYKRLATDRRKIVPWLDDAGALQGRRILEIGCGTGSSTIALAEQGAEVTGVDIDEGALSVAKERSKVYGVEAEVRVLNSVEMTSAFGANAFDCVIFFACLEHMTIAERLASLREAWEMLPTEGLLVIVETPNRLWYFDGHTSMLPFFHWLPNERAFKYSGSIDDGNTMYDKSLLQKADSLSASRRTWSRFGLRTVFVLVTLFALWLASTVHFVRTQRTAVTSIQSAGGSIHYDYHESGPRRWSIDGLSKFSRDQFI